MTTKIKLAAPALTVSAGGEKITLKPFSFGQLPLVAEYITNIITGLDGAEVSIPTLIAKGGEDIMHIIALACGKDRDWLNTIEQDEGIALLGAVVVLNKEQFTKKLMPALQKLAAGMAKAPNSR